MGSSSSPACGRLVRCIARGDDVRLLDAVCRRVEEDIDQIVDETINPFPGLSQWDVQSHLPGLDDGYACW